MEEEEVRRGVVMVLHLGPYIYVYMNVYVYMHVYVYINMYTHCV